MLSMILSQLGLGVAIGAALYYAWTQTRPQTAQGYSEGYGANEYAIQSRPNQDYVSRRQEYTYSERPHNLVRPSNYEPNRRLENNPVPAPRPQANTSNNLARPSNYEPSRRQENNNPTPAQRPQAYQANTSNHLLRPLNYEPNRRLENNPAPAPRPQANTSNNLARPSNYEPSRRQENNNPTPAQRPQAYQANTSNHLLRPLNYEPNRRLENNPAPAPRPQANTSNNLARPSNYEPSRRQENNNPTPAQRPQAYQANTSNHLLRPSNYEPNRRLENNPAPAQRPQVIIFQGQTNASNNFESPSNYEPNRRQANVNPAQRQSNEFNNERQNATQVNRSDAFSGAANTNSTNRRRRGKNNGDNYTQRQHSNQINNRTNVEGSSNKPNIQRQANSDPANTSCAFCSKPYEGDKSATRVTWCGHKFHLLCMNKFLPTQKRCPTCRRPIKWIDITNKCVVCLDSFINEPSNTRTRIVCGHKLHTECLLQWTQTKNRCPICKKVINPSKVQENECVICLESIVNNASKKRTNCGHEFHCGCLSDWLQSNNTCPLCRQIVS